MKDSELFEKIKNTKDWVSIRTRRHELNYRMFLDENGDGEKEIVLMFQESDGKKDWRDNLNFLPIFVKPYKKQKSVLRVHRGFAKEYKSGNDIVMEALEEAVERENCTNVCVCGWSNGAAMALLAAEDIFFRTGLMARVVTFGSPRLCADEKSVEIIRTAAKSVTEWCHESDIVTKLPPFGKHVKRSSLGSFSLRKLMNPWKYHAEYSDFLARKGR